MIIRMSALQVVRELSGAEMRSLRRDSMLRLMIVLPLMLALLTRWLVPWGAARFDVDPIPFYPLLMSAFVVFLAPVLVGYIVGIMLLDERDEGTLQAISVTPLPLWQYLAWKLTIPVVATTILTIVLFPVVGFMPFRWNYLPVVMVGAMWAPLLALLMSCFARNKLQGFVLMRVSNVLLVIPMVAWFFPKWEPLLAIFPAYWPIKSFWLAAEGQSGLVFILVGVLFHAAVIAWLYRRFQTVLRRSA
jgi:fluoroquinolone transport system permease protein